jgi:hypothetical protein
LKTVVVLAAVLLSSAFPSFAGEFKELSKGEVKEFARAAKAIEGAYRDSRYEQIRNFGPGILAKYSPVQIQADGFAKDLRGVYARTDSIVAYAVLRLHIDSLLGTLAEGQSLDEMYVTLRSADRIENSFASKPILSRFDTDFADRVRASARQKIETLVPRFLETAKRASKVEQAYNLINNLSYRSAVPATAKTDVLAAIETAYFDAMSSNSAQRLRDFGRLYPDYRPQDVSARLDLLEGDEIAFLLQRGSKDDLISFLNLNPMAPQVPNVKKRLLPLLYRAALAAQDLGTCQQFLTLFPEPSSQRDNILGLQAFILRSQSPDSLSMPMAQGAY